MNLHLHIKRNRESITESFNLSKVTSVEILEYDFVLFVLESKEELPTSTLEFILGNTILKFEETSHFFKNKYYYYLDFEELRNLLPNDQYFSKEQFEINGLHQKLSRLFINELGKCTPQVKTIHELYSFNSIRIRSPKINDENFQLIIEYLMFNEYFDEKIIYKNTLDSSNSNLSNSFLESIKKLHGYSKNMVDVLWQFKHESIRYNDVGYRIEDYNNSSLVDANSLPWLIDNLTEVHRISNNRDTYSFKKGSAGFQILKIPQPFPKDNFNTYENKIILGFLDTLISVIKDKKIQFEENQGLRSRNFTSFNDYLVYNLNKLIGFLLSKIADNFLKVHSFFQNELRVTNRINGFPNRLEGFLRKPHYKLFLDIMFFSQHLFAFRVNTEKKFQLEIESFDKLYEVFCLYYLRDTITSYLEIENTSFETAPDSNNKLRGVYSFQKNNIKVKLYYETFPPEIFQLARADKKYHENPDFILEIMLDKKKLFVIVDAKYKVYSTTKKFHSEMGNLSYKYLHKMGTCQFPNMVVGLYTLSLGNTNSYQSIYKNKYDLFHSETIFPQIGSLQLNPIQINQNNNPFKKILERYIYLCTQPGLMNLNKILLN